MRARMHGYPTVSSPPVGGSEEGLSFHDYPVDVLCRKQVRFRLYYPYAARFAECGDFLCHKVQMLKTIPHGRFAVCGGLFFFSYCACCRGFDVCRHHRALRLTAV